MLPDGMNREDGWCVGIVLQRRPILCKKGPGYTIKHDLQSDVRLPDYVCI